MEDRRFGVYLAAALRLRGPVHDGPAARPGAGAPGAPPGPPYNHRAGHAGSQGHRHHRGAGPGDGRGRRREALRRGGKKEVLKVGGMTSPASAPLECEGVNHFSWPAPRHSPAPRRPDIPLKHKRSKKTSRSLRLHTLAHPSAPPIRLHPREQWKAWRANSTRS